MHKIYFLFLLFTAFCLADSIRLADGGRTDYMICVKGGSGVDKIAAEELSHYLKSISGAEFRIAEDAEGKRIVIGDGEFGKGLKAPWWKISFDGDNVIIDGPGELGRWNAVHEFLRSLGVRWLNQHGLERVPKNAAINLDGGETIGSYPFAIRGSQTFYNKNFSKRDSDLFHARNGQNILLFGTEGIPNEVLEYQPSTHTFSCYIHPGTAFEGKFEKQWRYARQLPWIETKNYFELHPEWFPMNEKGERYTHGQLCFSNLELRKEMTKNAMEQLRREIERTGRDDGIVSMTMNDIVYEKFCNCPKCLELGGKYGVESSGAFYEYLVEFCKEVAAKYPKVRVKSFAYMSSLRPPQGLEMPSNLLVIFCPIYSSFIAPLTSEKEQKTLSYLEGWRKLGVDVWYWYYTLPYPDGKFLFQPPLCNVWRYSADFRKLAEVGIQGVYVEHDARARDRCGLFGLQSYLLLSLYRNPECDAWAVVKEYCDSVYGKASERFMDYMKDVEKGSREAAEAGIRSVLDTVRFPYINKDNMEKWQGMFDTMETMVDGAELFNVRLARLSVDATAITLEAEAGTDVSEKIERLRERIKLLVSQGYSFDMSRIDKWTAAIIPQKKD
ncbi:MAG: DUF4838 domain-containing protein [Victivallales bacterium]|nr:DUF4838 domain-containing protein [Victivallales bacterium]